MTKKYGPNEKQNKTLDKELQQIKIFADKYKQISDAEFKTLIIRTLKELIVYFNSIKKTQAEM